MIETIVTSVKLPRDLQIQLERHVIESGYGMRGKSKWIVSAICKFLDYDDFIELTIIADDISGLSKRLSFRMSKELANRIEEAVISVRRQHPDLEGVKSRIIRASILQALIRKEI